MNPVEVVARALTAEAGIELAEDDPVDHEMAHIALAVLFDLAKHNIRLVEAGDILEEDRDTESGTVRLLLRAE